MKQKKLQMKTKKKKKKTSNKINFEKKKKKNKYYDNIKNKVLKNHFLIYIISMVEAIANSVEDKLIDSLTFKLKEGASYITDRRSCTFYPSGSNIYRSQNGTKTIKINLSGDR